ncbi:hypothetical protein ASPCAL09573 [Aspergillus calidoustus]|uniref:GPI anchored protein n=1 Tax=Aspergillus calidoustus TaxID=454130 RepID=A0A0U5GWX1_ASPCI|nr:hypothetical protein ASPCAL09573 [Aspergillus calidoustus]
MHSSRLLLALTPILGALAADQVVTLNLPTDIGGSVTAAELIGSSASTTTLFIPCAENVTICQGGGVTLIAEPTAISMVVPLEDDVTYTASCSIDTSASTDSCVARTGTDDTWEDMGTDDLSATEITITATAAPASNSASPTTSPASTTLETSSTSGSTASAETDDASASPSSSAVEATDSDGAAIAMMTAAPWAGAVVAGLAAAVARI